ncbi:unnamed protein product [Absidia cylindrospora]
MLFKSQRSLLVGSSRMWTRYTASRMMYSTATTNTTPNSDAATVPAASANDTVDHHDHFHALYNNENQSVLDDLDHPHNEATVISTFAPNFNSVFDE